MSERDEQHCGVSGEEPGTPPLADGWGNATQTIDLTNLFTMDVYSTGTFDLSSIGTTSLGLLLDALPIPVLVIDRSHSVVFVNRACSRISAGYEAIRELPFASLMPLPTNPFRARTLRDKAESLIDKAFSTRKPQAAEAILEIGHRRIWARLHLRSVRIGNERQLLVIIQDLTLEKKLLRLSERNKERVSLARDELEEAYDARNVQLSEVNERLHRELTELVRTQEALIAEQRKFLLLTEAIPVGVAIIGRDGTCEYLNSRFQESFGHNLRKYRNVSETFENMLDTTEGFEMPSDWIEALSRTEESETGPLVLTVRCKEDTKKQMSLKVLRIDDVSCLVTCEDVTPVVQSPSRG